MTKNILITGGAGYVGGCLVPKLLAQNYNVLVYDILYFGKDHLPLNHPNLKVVEGDIRDIDNLSQNLKNIDTVLHLACISNDPSFELDQGLSQSINYDCFEPMVMAAKEAGVARFIYCSTCSVYGISDAPEVKEDHPKIPITLYNKFKGMCEPLLMKHQSKNFTCSVIRPATIGGYSSRTRLDLTVNILTFHALTKKVITVFGGEQTRPNLDIQDMCDLYSLVIECPKEKIEGEIFNVGNKNIKIFDIAMSIKKIIEEKYPDLGIINVKKTESNDARSYRINSDKVFQTIGFKPKRDINDSIISICEAFKKGLLDESCGKNVWYNNVQTMKEINAK